MKYLLTLALTCSFLFFSNNIVSAQSGLKVDIRSELKTQGVQFSLGRIVSATVNVAIVLGVIVLLLYFVRGAYLWLGAGGDKAQVEEARSVFTNGLIGMAILASVIALYSMVDDFFGIGLTTPEGGGGPSTPQWTYEDYQVCGVCPAGTLCNPGTKQCENNSDF